MTGNDDARSELLNQVIADNLAAEKLGNAPDRDEVLRQHPGLADDLSRRRPPIKHQC
jgi:hypothetical protein